MKRLKLVSGAAAAALVGAGLFAIAPITTSGADLTTHGCTFGTFPVAEASVSNLRVACAKGESDNYDALKLTDFSSAAWHDGAARVVKATATANSTTLNVTGGVLNLTGTFGDINRSVEAGFGKLKAGSFIVSETGTGAGGTIVLNQAPPKGGALTLLVENGPGRALTDVSVTGTNHVTSPTANFFGTAGIANDIGQSISGTGIPIGATITAVNSTTNVTISATTTNETGGCNPACGVNIGEATRNSTHRMVTDLTVNGSTITSASAHFQTSDIGLLVKGVGLPANAYITAIGGLTSATISAAAPKATAGIVTTIGLASSTAPILEGGSPVATLETELQLNPSLVAGSPDCAANFIAGTDITGYWNSPSKFALKAGPTDPLEYFNDSWTGLLNPTQRPQAYLSSSPIIGQIQFKTSAVDFAAYVTEASPGAPAVLEFPFLPTGLGTCGGTAIMSVFTFNADILSQNAAPSGYGKPGAAGFRRTLPLDAAGDPSTTSASITYYTADLPAITGVTTTKTVTTPVPAAGFFTKTANGLVEGQTVTVACGLNCTVDGLKANTAYYVHNVDANNFELSLTKFDSANGVAFVPIVIKAVDTVEVDYLAFTPVGLTFNGSCTIARPAPMPDDVGGFPCSAG